LRLLFEFFDTGVAPPVPASGPDGVLLAAGIGFEEGVVHVVEYHTDIHKSWSGLERRACLLALPRDRIEGDVIVTDEDVFRDLRRRRVFEPTSVFLVPVRHEEAAALTDISGTSFSLNATYLDWLVPGQRIWIESPANGYQAIIQTAGPGPGVVTVTVDAAPPAGNFPAIATTIAPVRPFYLDPGSPVGRWNVGAGRWSATLLGYGPRTVTGTGGTVAALDGLSYLDVRPMIVDIGAEDRPEGGVQVHDYDGAILPEWSRTVSDIFRAHQYHIGGSADRAYFWKFLDTVKGRQKAFLLPTWREDFVSSAGFGGTATCDFDDGGAYALSWFTDTTHRRFWVIDSTGAQVFRTATAASVVSGKSRVTFNSAVALSPPISLMFVELVRLANDETEFVYEEAGFGTVELRFMVVRQ
jgi:hypothetical protein